MNSLKDMLRDAYNVDTSFMSPIKRGTMNRCYRVETEAGTRFLKSYAARFYQPEQILRACTVQSLVRQAGLPAPDIIPNNQASAVTVTESGFYVLSEFVVGHEYARTEIPDNAGYQMGVTLAHLQDFLTSLGNAVPMELPDPIAAATRLEQLLALAKDKTNYVGMDAVACRLLQYKIEALHRHAALFVKIKALPAQWVHGDYQASNLIFDAKGQVEAILDFDQLQCRPRGLEMMRALDFSFSNSQVMEEPGLSFFRGYARAASLTEAEVGRFAPLWTFYWLTRPWPLDVRYEKPEDYDARWDALIQPPSDWWERNMDAVTERFLEALRTLANREGAAFQSLKV